MIDLNEVNISIFKAVSARYKSMGVDATPVQSRIIMFLYDDEELKCQKDIEKFISCNRSTISSTLDVMEKNGLILRVDSSVDFRKKNIMLTDKSIKIANILKNDKKKLDELLSLDISDEEYANFRLTLNKIKNNIERI
ncbi:MAG TPA: MarR family transcriptional regulator [Firmicutes bacterium]|nr:MarR family transcriptional regulator [Bacillota bacterium]